MLNFDHESLFSLFHQNVLIAMVIARRFNDAETFIGEQWVENFK